VPWYRRVKAAINTAMPRRYGQRPLPRWNPPHRRLGARTSSNPPQWPLKPQGYRWRPLGARPIFKPSKRLSRHRFPGALDGDHRASEQTVYIRACSGFWPLSAAFPLVHLGRVERSLSRSRKSYSAVAHPKDQFRAPGSLGCPFLSREPLVELEAIRFLEAQASGSKQDIQQSLPSPPIDRHIFSGH
jgi:hypothetical protein